MTDCSCMRLMDGSSFDGWIQHHWLLYEINEWIHQRQDSGACRWLMVCSWISLVITFGENQRSTSSLMSCFAPCCADVCETKAFMFQVLNWSWNEGDSNLPRGKLKQKWPEFPPVEVSCRAAGGQEMALQLPHHSPPICSLPFPFPSSTSMNISCWEIF